MIAALRRQLRDLQKRWRMQDWRINVVITDKAIPQVNCMGGEHTAALCEPNIFDKTAVITLPSVLPSCLTYEQTLAHEFFHVLQAELDMVFLDMMAELGPNQAAAYERRRELAREWLANAFAEAVTAK
jgi:hypothetical protein